MSKKFKTVKAAYDRGSWNKEMVANAVSRDGSLPRNTRSSPGRFIPDETGNRTGHERH